MMTTVVQLFPKRLSGGVRLRQHLVVRYRRKTDAMVAASSSDASRTGRRFRMIVSGVPAREHSDGFGR